MRVIHYLLGLCLLGMSNVVSAHEILDKISKLNQQAQYKEAIEVANHYLIDHANDGDVQFLLGKSYWLSGQDLKAIDTLHHVLSAYPTYKEARILLVHIYIKKQNYAAASRLIEQGLILSPQDEDFKNEKVNIASEIWIGPPYRPLLKLYENGYSEFAIQRAENYLKVYPLDADVGYILAKMYIKKGDDLKARNLLLSYIYLYPSYADLYVLLIQIDIQHHNFQQGKLLVNLALIFSPWNTELLQEKKSLDFLIAESLKPKQTSVHAQITAKDTASKPKPKQEAPVYKHEIGVYQQNYYMSDLGKVWDYTSVFYGFQTPMGKLYNKINYANRLRREAVQYEVEFFPKLNDYVYLDLDVTTANQPVLFPHYAYSGEAFVVLPHLFNPSFGAQMNRIDDRHEYSRFTASISKDVSISNLTFRSYFYVPGVGASSILYTLNYRYNFLENFGYMGVILGIGNTPDLANLETVNFLVLRNKILSPYINFALFKERLIINLSLLYQNQIFPNDRIRDWRGGTLGATWRF